MERCVLIEPWVPQTGWPRAGDSPEGGQPDELRAAALICLSTLGCNSLGWGPLTALVPLSSRRRPLSSCRTPPQVLEVYWGSAGVWPGTAPNLEGDLGGSRDRTSARARVKCRCSLRLDSVGQVAAWEQACRTRQVRPGCSRRRRKLGPGFPEPGLLPPSAGWPWSAEWPRCGRGDAWVPLATPAPRC